MRPSSHAQAQDAGERLWDWGVATARLRRPAGAKATATTASTGA